MTHFDVHDMTCNHCVNAVVKAVKSVDPRAYVSVDLRTKRVQIDAAADLSTLTGAIVGAGYTPHTPLEPRRAP